MNSTGMVRKIDELGRIVLPIELRRTLGIETKDKMMISVNGDTVSLTKYQDRCIFCDAATDLIEYSSKCVCRSCVLALVQAME